MFSFISNIVLINLQHLNENKQMDTNSLDLQGIKKIGAVFLCFDTFYSLILAAGIVIYLSFVIINEELLKYVAVTANLFK